MAATRLVNLRTGGVCDVSIMRPGPYGNPYVLGAETSDGEKEDRGEVIRKFRHDFYLRLKIDPKWKSMVEKLRGKRLGCVCTPLPCHGDVYLEYLNAPVV